MTHLSCHCCSRCVCSLPGRLGSAPALLDDLSLVSPHPVELPADPGLRSVPQKHHLVVEDSYRPHRVELQHLHSGKIYPRTAEMETSYFTDLPLLSHTISVQLLPTTTAHRQIHVLLKQNILIRHFVMQKEDNR